MRYRDENSNLKSHIRTLRWLIGVQFLVIGALWHGWEQAREDLRLHVPPDLRYGVTLKAGEIPPANVYTFAGYVFQQLNHWARDGQEDCGRQIAWLSPFLTPRFRAFLEADMELRGKRGELAGRRRTIQPIPGHGFKDRRVDVLGNGAWVVWLDVTIRETVRGMEVKNVSVRYPIRVVRHDVDPQSNKWGLALDGYADEGPRRLNEDEQAPDQPVAPEAT